MLFLALYFVTLWIKMSNKKVAEVKLLGYFLFFIEKMTFLVQNLPTLWLNSIKKWKKLYPIDAFLKQLNGFFLF